MQHEVTVTANVYSNHVPHQNAPNSFGMFAVIAGAALAVYVAPKAITGAYDAVSGGSFAHVINQGESKQRGYTDWNNCPSATRCLSNAADRDITSMTVGELLEAMARRGTRGGIFAAGIWQVTSEPLKEAVRAGVVARHEQFTPDVQNRVFVGYLAKDKRPAIFKAVRDGVGFEQAGHAAAKEWSALKSPILGRGVHDKRGVNKATIDSRVVIASLKKAHQDYKKALDAGLNSDDAYAVALGVKQFNTGNSI